MLSIKLVNLMHWLDFPSGFEQYCDELQRDGAVGTPTREEARKDYTAIVRSHNLSF
jgi:hypothetical protein